MSAGVLVCVQVNSSLTKQKPQNTEPS